jgi:hypothetical protein
LIEGTEVLRIFEANGIINYLCVDVHISEGGDVHGGVNGL